jgi:hypothetical protein
VRQLVETGAETPAGRFGLSDAADVVKTPPEEVCNDLPVLPPAPIETLRVVQAQFPNPYVVKAALESGEEVFVRVKSAKNFRKTITDGSPMLLKAKKEAGQWVLDGPLPRWPGKW